MKKVKNFPTETPAEIEARNLEMSAEADPLELPENAFRELAADEQYRPLMNPARNYPEVTAYSVTLGLVLCVIFSAAAAYLGLKVGQVFEAAIPIAIIAVGLSGALGKRNALGQNVIIQSIGACSGVIVAGAIFTLPALYILQAKYPEITVNFFQIFLSSLLGGVLGILFFIPFRKYFVKDMHGKYPFPEATATTQVLASGQTAGAAGGSQAKTLVIASLIGGIYDYVVETFGFWAGTLSTTVSQWGQAVAAKTKLVLSCNTGAAVLGLGYIIGLKYAFIITAGSLFAWWVIVPLMGTYGNAEIAAMDPGAIFSNYVRMIGIGGIAMAGVIGIIKSWPIIRQAVGLAGREFKGGAATGEKTVRWQLDISMKHVVFFIAIALVATLLFFWFGVIHNWWQALIAWVVVTFIAFLFTTVAANASGTSGIVASMVIGGVVCTALSMAGGFVTDLKVGYWLGTTPRKQEQWKFLGTLVSAATVGGVILVLNQVYGFDPADSNALVAPQANAMAKVIEPLMMGGDTPWILYMVGVILALLLNWLEVPVLAFCLGMFIPLSLNTPLLVGGAISWFVANSSKDKAVNDARRDRGTLIASGLIAGGALFGVFAALTRFCGFEYVCPLDAGTLQILGIVAYVALIAYLWADSLRAKKL